MTPASSKKGRAPTRQSAGAVPREKKSERRAPREEASQVDVQALQTAMEELSAAEEELREQNQALIEARAVIEKERRRYQDLFELAPDPYLVTDTHGVIQEGNRAAGMLLNTEPGKLIGKPLTVYMRAEQIRPFLAALVGTGRVSERIWQLDLKARGGGLASIEMTVSPELDNSGKVRALRWAIRDVTARVEAETELNRRAAILQEQAALLNLTHETVIVRDLNSAIVFWNLGAQEMYGWTAEEARGKITHRLLQTRFSIPLAEIEAKLAREGRWEGELVHTRKDGSELVVSSRQVLQRTRDGSPERILEINTDITEQKKNEERIRTLNARLEERVIERTEQLESSYLKTANILSSITDSYIAFDRDWRLQEINAVAEREIFQRPREEVIGKVFWEEYPQGQDTDFYRNYRVAVETGRPVHFEAKSRITGKWYEAHAYPSDDGLRVYMSDITERKRVEETRSQLAAIVESSDDAIISLDLDGQITNWNPAAERLFGYSEAEALGRPVSIIYPPDHADEFPSIMQRLLHGERIEHYETVRMRKDGSRLDVSVSMSPVFGPDGSMAGVAKITRDITFEKRAREAERFLSDASAALAGSLDYQTTLQKVAQLAVPFLADYSVADVFQEGQNAGQVAVAASDLSKEATLRELMRRYPPDPHSGVLQRILETGEPETISRVGDSFWNRVSRNPGLVQLIEALGLNSYMAVPMIARGRTLGAILLGMGESGRALGQADVLVARDLGHRAALAIDNARLYFEAQAAVIARDQFLSVASHEVKTPLTVIQGYTQLLRKQTAQAILQPGSPITLDPAILKRNLDNIEFAVGRLTGLINDLLDVSRMRDRELSISPEPVNLTDILYKVIDSVRGHRDHRVQSDSVNIQVEPSSEGQVWGTWDPGRLEQVLSNLIDNAIKYSPPGSSVIVRLGIESPDEDGDKRALAHLIVHDQGIGIPAEEMPKLFQPFIRTSNATARHYPGLGLGLAVSKEIVLRHGGQIWAESAGPDQGTDFHVILPGVIRSDSQ